MEKLRGLTWDHPRGRVWLEAASALWRERGLDITWQAQPLEGFEAHPIDDLCAKYDLIVLDHPHIGDAIESASVLALDEVLGGSSPAFNTDYVGPSLRSYQMNNHIWALPLDAATQVGARDPRKVAEAPVTWHDVIELAGQEVVALSLVGPHALLSLFSVASSLGGEIISTPGQGWIDNAVAGDALELFKRCFARTSHNYLGDNPIGMLEKLGSDDPLAYVPLVYGYVNYAAPILGGTGPLSTVAFSNAPRQSLDQAPGSMIGGTGMCVSSRVNVTETLKAYLEWLVSTPTQSQVVPQFAGQPAARSAWVDELVNEQSGNFYLDTLETIENSAVRPRHAGFPEAQQRGSQIVREVLSEDLTVSQGIDALTTLAINSHK